MKTRATAIVVALLVAVLFIPFPAPAHAQLPPSLTTDQPLYTLRDKQVVLQGAGFEPSQLYEVWLQYPPDNSTHDAGIAFTTTDKGEIPPATYLPIDPSSPLGTYLVSISNSTAVDVSLAKAHFGIWGPDKFVYQRTETVRIRGGGILPKASLKVTIRDPAGNFVHDVTVAGNDTGTFQAAWKIPPDAMTESYTIFIDGVGTYDFPDKEFVSISKFSATPALLNVTVLTQPNGPYERTQTLSAEFAMTYPDLSPVLTVKEDLKPVALYGGQFKLADLRVVASGNASGIWAVRFTIPKNASLELNYKFVIASNAFDDGNGNIGAESDVETASFKILAATLPVSISMNSTHFQVPFDAITAYIRVTYPDGGIVENATVHTWLTAAGSRHSTTVTYDTSAGAWIGRYAFSFGDLLKPGRWELTATVEDIYGNTGSASTDFFAEPYSFLQIVLTALVSVIIVLWFLSRFWRRLYLRGKRFLSAVRERLRPPSLGGYLSHSPVTP